MELTENNLLIPTPVVTENLSPLLDGPVWKKTQKC